MKLEKSGEAENVGVGSAAEAGQVATGRVRLLIDLRDRTSGTARTWEATQGVGVATAWRSDVQGDPVQAVRRLPRSRGGDEARWVERHSRASDVMGDGAGLRGRRTTRGADLANERGRGLAIRCRDGHGHVGDHGGVGTCRVEPPLQPQELHLPSGSTRGRGYRLDLLRALHVLVERRRAVQFVVGIADPIVRLILQPEDREQCDRDSAHHNWQDRDDDDEFDQSEARVGFSFAAPASGQAGPRDWVRWSSAPSHRRFSNLSGASFRCERQGSTV